MTHFPDGATVCVTREQFEAAKKRGGPWPMLLPQPRWVLPRDFQANRDPGDETDR